MPCILTVDRIEPPYAIVEWCDRTLVDLPAELLGDPAEGAQFVFSPVAKPLSPDVGLIEARGALRRSDFAQKAAAKAARKVSHDRPSSP